MNNLGKSDQVHNIAAINEAINFYSDNLTGARIEIKKIDDIFNKYQEITRKSDANKISSHNDAKKGLYLTTLGYIANLDATIALKHVLIADTTWEVVAAYKRICLGVYETLKTFDEKFNSWLKKESQATNLFEEYKEFQTCKNKFREKYGKEIREIRLHSEAHIEDDYVTYYDSILLLKNIDCNKMIFEFIYLIDSLLVLNGKIVKDSNKEALDNILAAQDNLNSQINDIIKNEDVSIEIKECVVEWKKHLDNIIINKPVE